MNGTLEHQQRSQQIFAEHAYELHVKTDRLFALLFILQWLAAIAAAMLFSPWTWVGPVSSVHLHIWAAVGLGGLLTSAPVCLALTRPGRVETRMVISVAQVLFSALLIHLSGGRIETHFHIFGSLAFLAFYRDWRVLIPATLVVAADHLLRGIFWPESVYGVLSASVWRTFEHAGWVVFEDIFLIWSCVAGTREMRAIADAQAKLETVNQVIEKQVEDRTHELHARTQQLEQSIEKTKQMESQLSQAQKLESIGQLAAGVAHEINTPMQFLNDNVYYLKDCTADLFEVIDAYKENLYSDKPKKSWQARQAEIAEVTERCRFESMQEQIPLAIEESLEGVQRVIRIVRAMKEFSHPGTTEKVSTDINEAIRSTATISKNRWKYAAELVLDLAPNLPDVKTLPAEINQVLLNLVVNAADAITDKLGEASDERGTITVRTFATDEHMVIEVRDTGCGIPNEVKQRIFDPFFTTKDVGKGTGQGLSISYDVVVKKHQGKLEVQSTQGEGTTFGVYLPLKILTSQEQEDETREQELLV